jgi:tetratricopeptide (TPR) repeat protein
VFPQARQAAEKALHADAGLSEAVVSLAFVEWVHGWNFQKADVLFRQAIDLNPNYALAHHWYSYFLVSMKRHDEAIAEIKKARELEGPLSLSVNTDIGEIYSWAGHYGEAEQYLQNVLQIEPNYAVAHSVLAINLLKQDRVADAVVELEKARVLENAPRILSVLGYAYAVVGESAKARKLIGELNVLAKQRYVSPFSTAIVHVGLGENDEAISLLDLAYQERSDTMAILKIYPLLDPIRSDPRFMELEKRVSYNP